jgi:curved DNA-binding protein CbpA
MLNEAWHVLGNTERRRSYDARLAETAERGQRGCESPTVSEPVSRRRDEQSSTSSERTPWTCVGCGQTVPRFVDECRCGHSRPQRNGATAAEKGGNTHPSFWPGSTWDRWRLAVVAVIVLTQAYAFWSKLETAETSEATAASNAAPVLSTSSSDASGTTVSQSSSPDATTDAADNAVREWARRRDNEFRDQEQRKWEERRRQAEAQSPSGEAASATPTGSSVSPLRPRVSRREKSRRRRT